MDALSQAEALLRAHRWDDGLAALAPLLKATPRDVKLLNLAGLALEGKGDAAQADGYFKRAITLDPRFVPALKNLSISEFNERKYIDAEKHLINARKMAPGDRMIALYLGEIDYRGQRYPRAVQEFESAGDLIATNATARTHLAIGYLQTSARQPALEMLETLPADSLNAEADFDLALALDHADLPERALPYLQSVRRQYPDSYDVGFDLMLVNLAARNYAEVIATGKDLIVHGHESSELNNVLAEAYANKGEFQHAGEAYKRAIALDPAAEDNYVDLASLCMHQHLIPAGMTVVKVGLETHPQSERLIFVRGLLYAMEDEYELAEKDFKLAAALSPEINLGYIGLSATYLETGHEAQAIVVLRQRLKENPNDASLLYLLGESLLRSGAPTGGAAYLEAQRALEKSTSLNPGLCLPHVSLGTIYLDQDRNQDAVNQFEQARAIDSRERSAYSHLAVAYKRLGQTEKSRQVIAALKDVIEQERHSGREITSPTTSPSGEDSDQGQHPPPPS
jgi:tetratricopeptide (TPR) repeat protein